MKDKILVYDGPGASKQGVLNLRNLLQALCGHSYDVKLASRELLLNEPWEDATALLVFPGGRDLPYARELNGKGNKRIRLFVEDGGAYLGICAGVVSLFREVTHQEGAYYGATQIEFEIGSLLEVSGERELSFYSGLCCGAAFPGFVYDSEEGAKDVELSLYGELFTETTIKCYWNGGGYFKEDGIMENCEILARYEQLDGKPPAIVKCNIGKGQAILSSVHPEHPPVHFSKEGWRLQVDLLRRLLLLCSIDAQEPQEVQATPTAQYLMAFDYKSRDEMVDSILENFQSEVGKLLEDSEDIFVIHRDNSLAPEHNSSGNEREIRHIIIGDCPQAQFHKEDYYNSLKTVKIGQILLHAQVVTSTQTLLDRNPKLLGNLPHGTVSVAARQMAGRGRGGNTWLSPPGCLMLSLVLRAGSKFAAKIVFVQYLFALAVVEALQYGCGRSSKPIGLCIKWPNDIYADLGPNLKLEERYVKLGGILVNSSYMDNSFCLVVGCGVNLSNPQPTLTINGLLDRINSNIIDKPIGIEEALATILTQFEAMWNVFVAENSFDPFMARYLSNWIHSGQSVILQESGQVAKIVRITSDFGLLRTRLESGKLIDLQPDGNSFDMLRGLIKRKE